jgi:hypothetical protein
MQNDMGQSIARICTTNTETVFVSMGIDAYQGTDLTISEAEQLVSALQIALSQLQLKKG